MALTADYQVELIDWQNTTIQLGTSTDYPVVSFDGLGVPNLRTSDTTRPRDHGAYLGVDYVDVRTVTLSGFVQAADADTALELLDTLKARWCPSADPTDMHRLTFRLPGIGDRQLFGRPRRLAANVEQVAHGLIGWDLEFVASDPFIKSLAATSVSVPVSSVSGGRTYDRDYDLTYPGSGVTGTTTVTVGGTCAARPTVVFHGPLTDPTLVNNTTGEQFGVNLTISAGDVLVVDFDARTVLLGGTSSRYGAVAAGSTWFDLEVGQNRFRLNDSAGSTTGSCTINFYDTYL